MTSSHAFCSFAFGMGQPSRFSTWSRSNWILRCSPYPSIGVVLLGTHHARDVVDPSMGFLAPAMYWYGWTATAALGAFMFGLIAAFLSERWTRWFWPGWLWVAPALAMIACVYLTMPWFRL